MAGLAKKAALVIGASRGIGEQIAVTLAKNGYGVGVSAKTVTDSKKTPGTIYSVSEKIKSEGGRALPILCDVRNHDHISKAVDDCIQEFGHLDAVVYNAGAILWKSVIETPMKRFDLMLDVNVRGAYALVQKVLPYFLERKAGHILLVSPPIYSRFFKGKTPYSITKVGMSVLVQGLAMELENTGVGISTLWPATVIESQVTVIQDTPPSLMRKADIFADATLQILREPPERYNGQTLIDEDLLIEAGFTDVEKYRCDPEREPPRMMPKKFPSLLVEEQDVNLKLLHYMKEQKEKSKL